MKVLQINSVCGKGSTGRIAVQISNYLNQCDVENYIAYGFGKSDLPNTFYFGNSLDSHLHSFLSRKLCWQGKLSHIPTLRLIRYIKRINPDVVHLHNIHGHYLNYKILFYHLKKMNCQVVWTFHDCWPFTGKCVHFTAINCEKWKTGCYECPQLDRYPDSKRDRSQKNYFEKKTAFTSISNLHIVTVSNWLKSVTEKSFFSNSDIRCIYNGIDTDYFSYQDGSIRDQYQLQGKFIILSVASVWNKGKGLDNFISLSKRLDDDEVIVLIGVTPEQMNVLPKNIIAIPNLSDHSVLIHWYSSADVFVNYSLEETFGLVVAEAMSCGTPAIVMNSTACPEVVDSDTGFVVEPNDIDLVIDAINTIKTKGKESYSINCKERIHRLFRLELMQRSYYELYKMLVEE